MVWICRHIRVLWKRLMVRRAIHRLSATERAARGEATHNGKTMPKFAEKFPRIHK